MQRGFGGAVLSAGLVRWMICSTVVTHYIHYIQPTELVRKYLKYSLSDFTYTVSALIQK